MSNALAIKRLIVFCGSRPGSNSIFQESALALAQCMAQQGLGLVYGGGAVGLMGILADEMLRRGGEVIGVIPEFLSAREVAHQNLTELHIVSTMHERKKLMAALGDAFVVLPGGAGTLDEFFEAWTWQQLNLHQKPCAILNVNGFYDKLLLALEHMVETAFLPHSLFARLIVDKSEETLIQKLKAYIPPPLS